MLSGELSEIKRQYGKNRLFLSAADMEPEQLAAQVRESLGELVTVHQVQKRGLVLQLTPQHTKRDVLSALPGLPVDVETFGNYEPSLTDIFVERAGDEA